MDAAQSNNHAYPNCDWPGCTEEGRTINDGLHPAVEQRLRAQGGFDEFIEKAWKGCLWLCYIHGPTPVKAKAPDDAGSLQ